MRTAFRLTAPHLRHPTYVLFFILVSGCIYQLSGSGASLPPGAETIAVPTLRNDTFEPAIEGIITQHIRDEFLTTSRLRLIGSTAEADLVLTGTIARYDRDSVSFDRERNVVVEYRVRIYVDIRLEDKQSGKTLWEDSMIEATAEYLVSEDPSATRVAHDRAVAEASRHLAQDLAMRVLEGGR
jgi:hypothetical protein